MAKKALSVGTVMVLHALARGHQYGFDLMEHLRKGGLNGPEGISWRQRRERDQRQTFDHASPFKRQRLLDLRGGVRQD